MLLLIPLHSLGIGVNLQVERGQQALVNSHCCDGWGCWPSNSSNSVAKARTAEAVAETSGSKPQANTTAGPKPQTSTTSITEANSVAGGSRAHSCYPG